MLSEMKAFFLISGDEENFESAFIFNFRLSTFQNSIILNPILVENSTRKSLLLKQGIRNVWCHKFLFATSCI